MNLVDEPAFQYSAVALTLAICIVCGCQAAQSKPEYHILGKWGRAVLIVNCIGLACVCAFLLAWGLSELVAK